MRTVLDFDKAVSVNLVLRRGDYYERTFLVKKNGEDYDWDGIEDVILEIKKDKRNSTKMIELKRSNNTIVTGLGYMTWILSTDVTDIPANLYESLELLLVYENDKPKLWFDGDATVKDRGIKL